MQLATSEVPLQLKFVITQPCYIRTNICLATVKEMTS